MLSDNTNTNTNTNTTTTIPNCTIPISIELVPMTLHTNLDLDNDGCSVTSAMSNIVELKFVLSDDDIYLIPIQKEVFIDLETGHPYNFVSVHGSTWRMTFCNVISDIHEAFTPCASEYNHRGIYSWNNDLKAYQIYKKTKKF
jgi:hypothetical protein